MAGEGDAKARFPRQEVAPGQKHDYLGDVEVYDAPEAGHSNATAADKASGTGAKAKSGAIVGVTDADTESGTIPRP
jgi:hypothetical protein